MVVARQWRDLKLRLRAGLLYEPEKEIPLGGLVLFVHPTGKKTTNSEYMYDVKFLRGC